LASELLHRGFVQVEEAGKAVYVFLIPNGKPNS